MCPGPEVLDHRVRMSAATASGDRQPQLRGPVAISLSEPCEPGGAKAKTSSHVKPAAGLSAFGAVRGAGATTVTAAASTSTSIG